MKYVNKTKLPRNPVDAEYRRQKSAVAKKFCTHPQHHLSEVEIINPELDEIITVIACDCGQIIK